MIKIFPSAAEIPADILRFHIEFNEPPDTENIVNAFALFNDKGEQVAHPFLDFPDGLWDRSGKVLTLMPHPGRIKSGLGASDLLGGALSLRANYELVVDPCALFGSDARQKGRLIRQSYAITAPRTEPIHVDRWTIVSPPARTREPLLVNFKEKLDWLSICNSLSILSDQNNLVDCVIEPSASQEQVQIYPINDWQPSSYRLVIAADIEDVAGNRINRVFEAAKDLNNASDSSPSMTFVPT